MDAAGLALSVVINLDFVKIKVDDRRCAHGVSAWRCKRLPACRLACGLSTLLRRQLPHSLAQLRILGLKLFQPQGMARHRGGEQIGEFCANGRTDPGARVRTDSSAEIAVVSLGNVVEAHLIEVKFG